MAKRSASPGGSSHTTRQRPPRHQAAQKGTKAVVRLSVFFPHITDGTPTPVCVVKVLPSRRKDFPQWELTNPPAPKEKAASKEKSPGKKAAGKTKEPAAPQVIMVSGVGDSAQYIEISATARGELDTLQHALAAAQGIHLTQRVPAREVFPLAIENVYFLAPEDVGDGYAAYKILCEMLSASHEALVGRMQRKDGSSPIAIFATEDGLVMYQLAPVGGTHDIKEVLKPEAWKGRDVLPRQRNQMRLLLSAISAEHIHPDALEDPFTVELRYQVDKSRRRGKKPLPCSDQTVPNIDAACAGAVRE